MHNRKLSVLLTAQRLFLEKGFLTTSIQDILDESNISKGTFYNYFSSKNECLIAIVEHGRDEIASRRRELLIGQERSSKQVLAKQISIRLEVNREFNLLPIFQAVFHSDDANLKAFINKYHMQETSWLINRLIDVYGESARPFAPDFAVILHGIMHHLMQSWKISGTKKEFSMAELVNFSLRRIDSIAKDMIETKDIFLGEQLFPYENITIVEEKLTKQQLLKKLKIFKANLNNEHPEGKQFSQFLINEIKADHPQIYVLETVIESFRKSFIKTSYELDARDIAAHLWSFIDTKGK